MGWGRLPEAEHDIAVVAWFEILSDAGMRVEQYDACYRAAQARKRELLRQGQLLSIVTPHDLCEELDQVRKMHAEIDGVRLLPETAASVCVRCDGTDWELMPDGSRRKGCKHEYVEDPDRLIIRDKELAAEKAKEMREQLSRMTAMKSMPKVERISLAVRYTCSECGRRVSSEEGWEYLETCRARMIGPVRDGERLECTGRMEVR